MSDQPCCVYRCFSEDGVLLYVGLTGSFERRIKTHRQIEPWFKGVGSVTQEWFENRTLGVDAERAAIRSENPVHNKDRYAPPVGVSVNADRQKRKRLREKHDLEPVRVRGVSYDVSPMLAARMERMCAADSGRSAEIEAEVWAYEHDPNNAD